jgi:protein-tyrosine phosphatase
MAEEIMRFKLNEAGLGDRVVVDSAGTGNWHAGETADPRTIEILANHGIPCDSVSRQLIRDDFTRFDLLLAMDRKNLSDMRAWAGAVVSKTRLFLTDDLPDPYYGGREGYENMFFVIEAGCNELMSEISQTLSSRLDR